MIAPSFVPGADVPIPSPDPLTPAHRHELEVGSAIPADLIAEEGARSVASAADLPMLDDALIHYDPEKALRFGQAPSVRGPGMYLPMENPQGHVSYQFKPDHPRLNDDGKPVKYETPPGTRNVVHVPRCVRRLLNKRGVPLWITEGWKKTMSGAGAGLCIVGLSGVWNWRVKADDESSLPLPDFDHITLIGRIVVIAFDSDARNNPKVRQAQRELRRFLEGRGATVLIAEIPEGPDGAKWGLDDFIAAGGSTDELLTDAQIAAISGPTPDGHVAGSDGASVCDGNCPTSQALREQLHEHKLADDMRRTAAFSAGEVEIARHYASAAASAASRGETKISMWSETTNKVTGQSAATATRFHNAYRVFQEDPALKDSLPFTLEERWKNGKRHIDLVVTAPSADAGPVTTTAILAPLARLVRPETRKQHGGKRDACPKCDSPMTRTTVDVCQNDACGHTVYHKPQTVGQGPFHDETVPVPSVQIGADEYRVSATWSTPGQQDQGPFHDETMGTRTYVSQDETVSRQPAAFVSRDDIEAAAGRRLWAVPTQEPRCVRSGCLNAADNGFICAHHLAEAPPIRAVAGGAE